MTDTKSDLPNRMGLKPYSEFEMLMFDLFKRVAPEVRDQTLRKIYFLMGQKKVLEATKKKLEDERYILKEKQESIATTRRHISTAIKELEAAAESFHEDLPPWFDFQPTVNALGELDTFLAENEVRMGRMVQTLSDPEGTLVATQLDEKEITTTVSLTSPPMKTPFDLASRDRYEFELPDQRTLTIDDPFIECVLECLPPKPPGSKRSRFGRDKVLENVFNFMGEPYTRERFTKIVARLKKLQKLVGKKR
jgi:hypothetical protein